MTLTTSDILKLSSLFEKNKVEILEEVKDMVSHLPSKEEYYKREDKMMKELKEIREEITVLLAHSSNHSDRLENLEKIHPKNKHFATVC